LWLALFPIGLSADHDISPLTFASPVFCFSLATVIGLLYALMKIRKAHPILTFWGLWFFVNLLASSSLVPLNEFMQEHLTYISMFGFCGCLGYVCSYILSPMIKPASLVTVMLLLLIAGYSATTFYRNYIWKDDLSLWSDTIKKSPTKIRPHLNLAQAYIQRKSYDAAIQQYNYVLQLNHQLPHPYSGLGIVYLRKGDLKRSGYFFQKALTLDPEFIDAKTGIGMIYYKIGDYERAQTYLTEIYPSRRESPEVLGMLIDSLRRTRRTKEAIDYLMFGIRNTPSFSALYPTLMETQLLAGDFAEASRTYDRYHASFPSDALALLRTSEMLQKLGRTQEASQILRSISSDPEYGEEAQRRLKSLSSTS
jgi:Flp pilus assembly protein TadD